MKRRAWFFAWVGVAGLMGAGDVAAQQTASGRFRIQVYAATVPADAREVAGQVHEALERRYATYVGPRSKYHVVRVGDFDDTRSAQPALRVVRSLGFSDAWIAKNDPMQTTLVIGPGEPSPAVAAAAPQSVEDAEDATSAAANTATPMGSPGSAAGVTAKADGSGSPAVPGAGAAAVERKRLVAVSAGGGIRIDGRLDEAAWANAAFVSDFQQKGKDRGFTPKERTEVAFLYDDEALYVGARLFASNAAEMRELVTARDDAGNAERFLVSLDTYRDRQTAYTFGVTIGGARVDYHQARDNEGWKDDSFDPVWDARVTTDSTGWYAELRIPYSQLRFESSDAPVWGLNVRRWNPATFLNAYWVVVPYYETGWSSRFGELAGLRPLRGDRRVEVVPWALAGTTMPDSRLTAQGALRETATRGGADLKIGLASNLTLDATINPDFGQVEADPAEVNLSAYETFFPEKRPFFLEARELFRSRGPNFFYSRRIGSVPPGTIPGGALETPANATILGAVKLTGRLSSGLSIGGLTAVTARENVALIAGDGQPTSVAAAPPSAFGVFRVSKELGPSGSNAGLFLTAVERSFDGSSGLGQVLTNRAYAGAGDWNLRFGEGLYEVSGHAGFSWVAGEAAAMSRIQTSSAHYFQRPDVEHVRFDSALTTLAGYTAGLSLSKFGGANWFWDAAVRAQSPGFEIRDAGSQGAADRIDASAGLRYSQRGTRGRFKAYTVGGLLASTWDFGGTRQYLSPGVFTDLTWPNLWRSYVEVGYSARALSSDLTRGGPLMGTPSSVRASASLSSSSVPRTQWFANANTFLDGDGGWSASADGGISWLPGERLRLSVNPGFSRSRASRQYFVTEQGGGTATYGLRYVFSSLDRTEIYLQLRSNLALTPDLSLQLYAEPFASNGQFSDFGELPEARSHDLRAYGTDGTSIVRRADGDYDVTDGAATFTLYDADFRIRSFRSNAVLRWEWRRGSTFHLIWQQNRWLYDDRWEPVGPASLWRTVGDNGENIVMAKLSYWLAF